MASLKDAISGKWNWRLIVQIFTQAEVNSISQIPLSYFGTRDQLVRIHSKNGIFTVHSAYHLPLNQDLSCGSTSFQHQIDSNWQAIWKLKVPETVK